MKNRLLKKKAVMVIDSEATGAAVRRFRENLKISLRETARHIGWSGTYLSDLELGKRTWTEDKCHKVTKAIRDIRNGKLDT